MPENQPLCVAKCLVLMSQKNISQGTRVSETQHIKSPTQGPFLLGFLASTMTCLHPDPPVAWNVLSTSASWGRLVDVCWLTSLVAVEPTEMMAQLWCSCLYLSCTSSLWGFSLERVIAVLVGGATWVPQPKQPPCFFPSSWSWFPSYFSLMFLCVVFFCCVFCCLRVVQCLRG